jgi:hypothetical protein
VWRVRSVRRKTSDAGIAQKTAVVRSPSYRRGSAGCQTRRWHVVDFTASGRVSRRGDGDSGSLAREGGFLTTPQVASCRDPPKEAACPFHPR